VDLSTLALESIGKLFGRTLYGYLDMANDIGPDTASNMYQIASGNKNLDAKWFSEHMYLARITRPDS
jgi:hypothetical protein